MAWKFDVDGAERAKQGEAEEGKTGTSQQDLACSGVLAFSFKPCKVTERGVQVLQRTV